ncbi:MAG: NmrA family NAD(P)-binding protein [Pseudomonadota bacterium]
MSTSPILVIGSTGKTGRRIAQQLAARGYAVRHGSRQSEPRFDWDHVQTWTAALQGVESAYIAYSQDLAFPGAPEKIEALTQCAVKAGVKHLVLLSGRNEVHAQHCEEIVKKCGLSYTLVRASWFSQNFNEGYLLAPVLEGMVALPAGDVLEPFIDADDIADVAVAALTDARHAGQLYELTGPRLISFSQAAAEISRAAGREVQYIPISFEAFHAGISDQMGAEMATLLTDLCKETLDGRNASLANGVQRALGREPRDFADFCRASAASGVWNSSK